MELEVMIPSPAVDFNFDSACTSPYITAPSSPQRIGNFFFSAPTSPTRASSFFLEFNSFSGDAASSGSSLPLTIPFNWEESPGIPKTKHSNNDDTDFEFDFSGQLDRTSLSADELFDGGKIKPLKPPPRLQFTEHEQDSPRSPRSPTISARIFKEALSPRHKKRDFDPFAAAIEQTRRDESNNNQQQRNEQNQKRERGREMKYDSSASSRRQKGTRSLSPFRVSDIFESENNQQSSNSSTSAKTEAKQSSSSSSTSSFSTSAWRGYKKWRLKDFLLFRSASEGRASSKDPLKKYSLINKSTEDVKNSSFRSTESGGAASSSRRRGPAVSAHEMHYTANRAVSEEMRRKTFLPYKHGLLGCLGFNPTVQGLSRGLGSLTRG